MSNKIYKYNFLYKTTNLSNGKYYYGIHSTDDINDGYLGSGIALKRAIQKYGKQNFLREIVEIFKTRQEALDREKEIVNKEFCLCEKNYNIIQGGGWEGNWWHSLSEDQKQKYLFLFSKISSGYNNSDFKKRWEEIYKKVMDLCIDLVCWTNLPDYFIKKIIRYKTGHSLKIHRLINYYQYLGMLKIQEENTYPDYFSIEGIRNTASKTTCEDLRGETKIYRIYKALNPIYINNLEETLTYLLNDKISDSMLINGDIIIPTFKQGILSRLKYYKYLEILKEIGKKTIIIREICPNTQRNTAQKTIYKVRDLGEIDNYKLIETKEPFNEYKANFNGKIIQLMRI